jgi:hypothetical protein
MYMACDTVYELIKGHWSVGTACVGIFSLGFIAVLRTSEGGATQSQ